MRAFGYRRGEASSEQPLELHEVTLSCSLDELHRLRAFLETVISEREAAGTIGRGPWHEHLQDRDPAWRPGDADLILHVPG